LLDKRGSLPLPTFETRFKRPKEGGRLDLKDVSVQCAKTHKSSAAAAPPHQEAGEACIGSRGSDQKGANGHLRVACGAGANGRHRACERGGRSDKGRIPGGCGQMVMFN